MPRLIIHPHLITIETHKCYTRKELRKKIKHNKSAVKLRELMIEPETLEEMDYLGMKIIVRKHGGVIV